jgi:signal transduction histidine kinase
VGFFDCYGSEALQKCASARFDERLAERTRIARELADTLVRVPFCIKSLSAPR